MRCCSAATDSDLKDCRKGAFVAEEVRAEMTASVGKVVVAPGDRVRPGDTLVVLESMKMEFPVVANAPGSVLQVAVSEGDAVREGDLIVTIA